MIAERGQEGTSEWGLFFFLVWLLVILVRLVSDPLFVHLPA